MMDMEEIILEHMYIREWVDKFVKEAVEKENKSKNKSACQNAESMVY